ncbi:MAG: SpoIID/LytB domain-containing protein [Limnochordales bacterium]|nr:SpoIID/LytB domain-containing protein [Limnochordales bacterium]
MSSFTRARINHTRYRHGLAAVAVSLILGAAGPPASASLAGSGDRASGLEEWLARLHAPGEVLLSVALSRDAGLSSDFNHSQLSLSAPQGLLLIDSESGAVLLETGPGETVQFMAGEGGVIAIPGVASAAQPTLESDPAAPAAPDTPAPAILPLTAPGFLVMARQVGEPVTVLELSRPGGGPSARYRGALLVLPSDKAGYLWLVNRVGLESYLRGVVPVEMPVSFSLEALKAQAVVARTYALYQYSRGRGYANGLAGLCDGPSCQVYYGAGVERARSDQAVEETAGLVITYEGEPIPAYYSSTAGGHTESAALLWGNGAAGGAAAADKIPYLRGVPDDPQWASFDDEERFRSFLAERPASFDDGSPYYRWEYTWTRAELEAHLKKVLPQLPARAASFTPRSVPATTEGATIAPANPPAPSIYLQDIVPVRRGVSGRLLALEIVTVEGSWTVQGELYIRRLFPVPRLGQLPSSAAAFDFVRDSSGVIEQVRVTGTGSGHGVGLSQYGADGMARRGYQFTDIIAHYFPGTETRHWSAPSQSQAGSPASARNEGNDDESGTEKEEGAA